MIERAVEAAGKIDRGACQECGVDRDDGHETGCPWYALWGALAGGDRG